MAMPKLPATPNTSPTFMSALGGTRALEASPTTISAMVMEMAPGPHPAKLPNTSTRLLGSNTGGKKFATRNPNPKRRAMMRSRFAARRRRSSGNSCGWLTATWLVAVVRRRIMPEIKWDSLLLTFPAKRSANATPPMIWIRPGSPCHQSAPGSSGAAAAPETVGRTEARQYAG